MLTPFHGNSCANPKTLVDQSTIPTFRRLWTPPAHPPMYSCIREWLVCVQCLFIPVLFENVTKKKTVGIGRTNLQATNRRPFGYFALFCFPFAACRGSHRTHRTRLDLAKLNWICPAFMHPNIAQSQNARRKRVIFEHGHFGIIKQINCLLVLSCLKDLKGEIMHFFYTSLRKINCEVRKSLKYFSWMT